MISAALASVIASEAENLAYQFGYDVLDVSPAAALPDGAAVRMLVTRGERAESATFACGLTACGRITSPQIHVDGHAAPLRFNVAPAYLGHYLDA